MKTQLLSIQRSFQQGTMKFTMTVMLSVFLSFALVTNAYAAGAVSGRVFRDYNANGVKDTYEPGVGNITVTAYDADGNNVGSTTTAADGTYSITVTVDKVRLEVTGLPAYLQPGPQGADSETTVTFATSPASGVDIGVNNPAEYCENNPYMCAPMHINGDTVNTTGPTGTMQRFLYNSTGNNLASSGTTNRYRTDTIADKSQIGSTWGLAWQRSTKTLYAAAFLKRHVGLGPNGLGAIYQIPNANTGSPGTPTLFFDLATVASVGTVPSNAARGLGAPNAPSHDSTVYADIGKKGLGDIDISEDESTLWVVSLNDKKLYSIPTTSPNSGNVTGYPITDPGCASISGVWRPFAVKVYQGDVYVGGVCDASLTGATSDQLYGYVYRFDGAAFTPVFNFPLNYPRGLLFTGCGAGWLTWNDVMPLWKCAGWATVNPQPIFSDIEFDIDGSMIIGLMDRLGHQVGWNNFNTNPADTTNYYGGLAAGDTLRAYNNNGTFVLENNATAGPATTAGANNGQGPGNGEFYYGDTAYPNIHQEKGSGGLALIPGKNEIALTSMDPNQGDSGGQVRYSNTTGAWLAGYDLFQSTGIIGTFGKATGLGDLEALCSAAPIEVGNRIWIDSNANGIQDPDEMPLSGVTVQLYNSGGTLLASAVTNANGEYFFSSDPGRTDTTYAKYNIAGLTQDTTGFEIRVDTTQTTLSAYILTTANADASTDGDLRDSDATISSTTAIVTFDTGGAGANNHTYDIGFIELDFGDLPNSFTSTLLTNNGANHIIVDDLYLGGCVDSESDGQPDSYAGVVTASTGDDGNTGSSVTGTCVNNDDEDGIVFITPLIPGYQACVAVTAVNGTGAAAILQGWVDFNGNGVFDSGEELTTVDFNGGGISIPDGGVTSEKYCFDVPSTATFDGGETHMRFRYSRAGGLSYDGGAPNGEVEDYYAQFACVGNYVWDDTSGATVNVQDLSDAPISGVTTRLVWAGPDDTFDSTASDATPQGDDLFYTDTTDTNGVYNFCGLTPTGTDTYRIDIPTPPVSAPKAVMPNTGSDITDSDGTQSSSGSPVTGVPFTVPAPVSMTTGEYGNQDVTGSLNNYPDAQDALNFDFGFAARYNLGDYVWYDTNIDGIQDSAEPGVNGVTASLFDNASCSGSSVSFTVTANGGTPAADGYYQFADLIAGTYSVQFSDIPTGMQATLQNQGSDDTVNSDADRITLCIESIVLGPNDPDEDLGLYSTGSIGDQVWCEQSTPANTTYESGTDANLSSITVNLYTDPDCDGNRSDGALVSQPSLTNPASTDGSGQYLFSGLPVALDSSSQRTCYVTEVDTSDADLGSCTKPVTPVKFADELTTDTPDDLADDFGFEIAYKLGDYVWFDTNVDGLQDAGEPGVNDVTVSLFTNGSCIGPVASTTVTANGGSPAAHDGFYQFPNLVAGTYSVQFSNIPAGLSVTLPNEGSDDTVDSDADTTTLCIENITLGPDDPDEDLGVYVTGSIGDQVWCEMSSPANTVYDSGVDSPLSNISVNLYTDPNCDGSPLDGVVVTVPATTNISGQYLFSSLPVALDGSGQRTCYVSRVDTTDADLGSCTNPVTPTEFADELKSTVPNDLEDDFGFQNVYNLGDYVWYDTNIDGIQDSAEPGVNGVTASLFEDATCSGSSVSSTTTANGGSPAHDGYYQFTNLLAGTYSVQFSNIPAGLQATLQNQGSDDTVDSDAIDIDPDPAITKLCIENITLGPDDPDEDLGLYATGSIGDQVWCEQSIPANTTYESGTDTDLSSITVNLYTDPNCDGDRADGALVSLPSLTNPASTDGSGQYLFDNLPVGLAGSSQNVCYVTEVDTTDPELGACSNPFTPVKFADKLTTAAPDDLADDFGFITGGLGDFVWIDYNHDGIQDGNEPGVENVTVNLLDPTNSNAILSSTQTDPNGYYFFPNLDAGQYVVQFVIPTGYVTTLQTQGSDDTVDSNIDSSGYTATITLGTAETNPTIDAGLYQPSGITKTIKSTDQIFTNDTDVAIGEVVTYQVDMVVSPGPHEAMKLVDTVDDGLAFVRCVSLTGSDPALTTDLATGFAEACDPSQTDPNANPKVQNSGRIVTWGLGTVSNGTAQDQTLTLTYEAVVLDIQPNQSGVTLSNSTDWSFTGFAATVSAPDVEIIEPDLSIQKAADSDSAPFGASINFSITIAHTAASQTPAYDVIVTDALPSNFTFVPGTISSTGLAPTSSNYDAAQETLTFVWDEFPLAATSTVSFTAVFNGPAPAINSSNVEWTSLPLDPGPTGPIQISSYNPDSTERWYDPADPISVDNYRTSASVTITLPDGLPDTGFAPNMVTTLPLQPKEKAYSDYGNLWIEIPSLGVKAPIVGVPLEDNGWDATWLGNQVGYLEGTAFPSLEGNTVLSAHVFNADGLPGPFSKLSKLSYGSQFKLHVMGMVYTYEVRTNQRVTPDDLKPLGHKVEDWVTLLTCESYNESKDIYKYRRMVQAVFISAVPEK